MHTVLKASNFIQECLHLKKIRLSIPEHYPPSHAYTG
jgi:hypothetical protein